MHNFMSILSCCLMIGIHQNAPKADRSLVGTWHGTSVCVDHDKDSACRDEEVVYVVKGIPSVRDTVEMEAFKIVNGERVSMGIINLAFSAASRSWSFEMARRVRAVWAFQAADSTLTGTLAELPSMRLIRRVSASRVKER